MGKSHHVLLSVTLFLLVCISALCHRRSFDNGMHKNSAATERRNGLPTAESLIEESTEANMKLEHGDKLAATHGDRSSLKKTGASSKAGASSQQSTSSGKKAGSSGKKAGSSGRRLAKVVPRRKLVPSPSQVQWRQQVEFQWWQVQVGFKLQQVRVQAPASRVQAPASQVSSFGKSKSGSSSSKSGFNSNGFTTSCTDNGCPKGGW